MNKLDETCIKSSYLWSVHFKCFQQPVVALTSCLKLKCTYRVVNVLKRVYNAVSIIICRVYTPFITCMRMWCISNTICYLIPHIRIRASHIHFKPQCSFVFFYFATPHILKQPAYEQYSIACNNKLADFLDCLKQAVTRNIISLTNAILLSVHYACTYI
jgi:hypothetical protein